MKKLFFLTISLSLFLFNVAVGETKTNPGFLEKEGTFLNNLNFAATLAFLNYQDDFLEKAQVNTANNTVKSDESAVGAQYKILMIASVTLIGNFGISIPLKTDEESGIDFKSYGIGINYNLKKLDRTFFIGVGFFNDRFKAVRSDFVDGKSLPAGETEIQYKTEDHPATYFTFGVNL